MVVSSWSISRISHPRPSSCHSALRGTEVEGSPAKESSQKTCSDVSAVTRTPVRMPGKWWWTSATKPSAGKTRRPEVVSG